MKSSVENWYFGGKNDIVEYNQTSLIEADKVKIFGDDIDVFNELDNDLQEVYKMICKRGNHVEIDLKDFENLFKTLITMVEKIEDYENRLDPIGAGGLMTALNVLGGLSTGLQNALFSETTTYAFAGNNIYSALTYYSSKLKKKDTKKLTYIVISFLSLILSIMIVWWVDMYLSIYNIKDLNIDAQYKQAKNKINVFVYAIFQLNLFRRDILNIRHEKNRLKKGLNHALNIVNFIYNTKILWNYEYTIAGAGDAVKNAWNKGFMWITSGWYKPVQSSQDLTMLIGVIDLALITFLFDFFSRYFGGDDIENAKDQQRLNAIVSDASMHKLKNVIQSGPSLMMNDIISASAEKPSDRIKTAIYSGPSIITRSSNRIKNESDRIKNAIYSNPPLSTRSSNKIKNSRSGVRNESNRIKDAIYNN